MKWDISLASWDQLSPVCHLLEHLQPGPWQSREGHSSPWWCVSPPQQQLDNDFYVYNPMIINFYDFCYNPNNFFDLSMSQAGIWSTGFASNLLLHKNLTEAHPLSAPTLLSLIFMLFLNSLLWSVLWHLWECLLPALFILSPLHLSVPLEDGTTGKAT